jgi:RNA polymerase sigma-70 factor (ECF subfamily)
MDAEERIGAVVAAASCDLLAYFERRVTSREDAADLLGEALLVAWRRVTVVPSDPLDARLWLFGVARNVLANHQRGVRRRLAMADRLRDEVARVTRLHVAPDDGDDRVRAAVKTLPEDLRELVMLVHWDGFGIAEAGQILGLGASTARGRYARARERLIAELTDPAGATPGAANDGETTATSSPDAALRGETISTA